MRKFLAAFIVGSLLVPAAAYSLSDAPEMPVWMTAAGEHEDKEGRADEYWIPSLGDMMIGASRSAEDERLNFWEQMRIQKEGDEVVVFWAVSGDQNPVRFQATVSAENAIVFENPDHDYAQSPIVDAKGEELKAEISLMDGSKAVQFSFRLMRPHA